MLLANAEEPDRAFDGAVALAARKDRNGRRAGEAALLDVPAAARKQPMAGGGETGDVGHLAAGDESEAGRSRKTENLLQPSAGYFLGDRGGGTGSVEACVLVPRSGEPVGGERRREGAADHPGEETAPGAADQAGLDIARQFGDHLLGRNALVAKRVAEARANGRQIRGRSDRRRRQPIQVGERLFEGFG